MKYNYLFFVVVIAMVMGCAVSKKVTNAAVGQWQYKVTGTPDGDYQGIFTIQQNGADFTGQIMANQQSSDLKNIVISDNQLTCSFDFMNYDIQMSGTFEGDSFRGNVSAEGQSFEMTAERVKVP